MFDYVHTQLNSNCISTSKQPLTTKPAPQKAGFVVYFLASNLKSVTDKSALTTDATITARTAMS